MGIQGLLPFLKDASTQVNVKMLAGYTVAVDAYCWIYRGAFACAMDLARGDKSDMYVKFVLKYVNMLLSHGIKPVIVFDGCNLPSKQGVEDSRRERKQLYLQKGKQFLRDGNTAQARECFQKCINVTPQMAHEVMEACRALGVDCIVAPYEADAQLAYLNKCGIAQAVITEDSDLLAFGCDRVIFKLDLNGNGTMIEKHRLSQCLKIKAQNFTFDKFRYMCILCGCDYLPSLHGIGPAKAAKLLSLTNQSDMTKVLRKIGSYLKSSIVAPTEYIEGFVKADNTFLYQLAFDPMKKELVPLHEYPPGVISTDMPYAGEYKPGKLALGMALGNIDIHTGDTVRDFNPLTYKPPPSSTWHGPKNVTASTPRHKLSMWHPDYKTGPKFGTLNLKEVKTAFTKGKEVTVQAPAFLKKPEAKPLEPTDVCTDSELAALYGSPPNSAKREAKKTSVSEKGGSSNLRKRLAIIRPGSSADSASGSIVVSRHFKNSYEQAVKDLKSKNNPTDNSEQKKDTFLDMIDNDCSSEEPSRSVDVDTINDEKEEDLSLEPTEPSWRKELQSFQRQGKIGNQNDNSAKTEKRKRVLSEEDGEEETSSPENEPNVNTPEASIDSSLVNALPKLSEELFSEIPHKETPKNPFKVATPKQGSAFSWARSAEKQITLKSSVSSLGRFKYSTLSQAKRKKTSQEEVNNTTSSQEEVDSTKTSQEAVDMTGSSQEEVKNSTSSQESVGELPEEESLSKSPVGNSSLKLSHVKQSISSFDNCSVYSMDSFTPTDSQNSGSASFSQGSQYFTASEGNSTQVSTTEMSQTSGDTTKEEVTEIKEESQQPVCSQSLEDKRYSEENNIKTLMREKESARSHDALEQVSSYFEKSALPSLSQTALDQRAVVQDMGRRAMEDGMGTPRMGKPSRGKVRQVGLSRRSCPSQTKRKRNNENSSTQPKISNFLQQFSLKKDPSQKKKEEPIRKPMSPSKANVVIDCTPETEPSIAVSLNGAKVKRNIFDNE
ncbi:exonuclease 1-like [Branchiostoma floridae]|uniref:Exonuclease 1 n=1 Tax=Branchiostoma floridae TaxID=7739 RepID=A0A9J7KVQ2_BRAFL|nr:exonuclease 1-like [Branchiostoma floridae]